VNVEALYTLTRKIVPGMVERKHGGILNIASIVAFQAIPYWTTYAATKAFVLAFGEGLSYELRNSGVRVVTVCPGFTRTGLYADSGVPAVWPGGSCPSQPRRKSCALPWLRMTRVAWFASLA
jgi:short-subunit dehydrogenase